GGDGRDGLVRSAEAHRAAPPASANLRSAGRESRGIPLQCRVPEPEPAPHPALRRAQVGGWRPRRRGGWRRAGGSYAPYPPNLIARTKRGSRRKADPGACVAAERCRDCIHAARPRHTMPSDSIETPSGARASELRAEIARLTRTRDALREAVASERSEKSDAPFDERSMAFTLTSALSELVWLQTADGALVYCSPSVERALGWRLVELAALDLMELVHPADAADASTLLEPRGSGASAPVELRVRRKDDGYVWMESRVMAVTLDGVRHRLFLSTEISRRKQAELKLLEHES